ncbi:MAG: iron ABC transporter permease [Bacillaceae bacterium]|nr:iron ABC transporter permease [Bacillaceae bacterium]
MMEERRLRFKTQIAVFIALIIATFFVSLNTGVIQLSPAETIRTLLGKGTDANHLLLFEFRMPRMVLSILAGAALAVSGAIFQTITRNELADPGIIGINVGASVAIVSFIFLTGGTVESLTLTSKVLLPLAAFAGAMTTALLIYMFAWNRGVSPLRLVLVGVALNAILSALLIVIQLQMEANSFMKALVWLSGSIWAANWDYVTITVPAVFLIIPFVIYKSRYLNVLHLGDQLSTGLGLHVERERQILIILAVALAGSAVAVSGNITFLGLIAPHIARKLIGPQHERFMLISALIGALFLLLADLIGRVIIMPSELPVGLVVACLGAPYFLYLLMKS